MIDRLSWVRFALVVLALTAGAASASEPAVPDPQLRCAPDFPLPSVNQGAVAGASGAAASESAASGPAASGKAMASPTPSPAPPDSAAKEFPHLTPSLVERLRGGGYVLVFRHSTTDWGQRDAEITNFEDRTTQRNLSKPGEAQATQIGKDITSLRIPIGAVKASPMWRCRDTAQLAFGRHEATIDLFQRGGQSRAARVAMLSTKPDSGNLVLVTHQDVLIPIITGLHRDQLKEGDAFVVKPLGDKKFEIEAQVSPEDWLKLGVVSAK
jgi:phosphohistidine phosphatase SixA